MEESLQKFIGKRIRLLRLQKGLTQEQVEEMADLGTNYVYKLEHLETNIKINTLVPLLQKQDKEDSEEYQGNGHYTVDEKARQAYLTENGQIFVEEWLKQQGLMTAEDSLFSVANITLLHHVNAALRANT